MMKLFSDGETLQLDQFQVARAARLRLTARMPAATSKTARNAEAPELRRIFSRLTNRSHKVDIYFPVYQALFEPYRAIANLTFVEIGVMDGGSLLMWREFFGPKARIIGVDQNPIAEKMREQGFELFIGDQASPEFWQKFYREVGPIDILLDDGGHTNRQQIVTVECALDHVKDGGTILVEDVVTSYLKPWGNPSRFSFMNYAKRAADRIQSRSSRELTPDRFFRCCYSVSFYSGMAIFKIDRRLCVDAAEVRAGDAEIGAVNYWDTDKRLASHARGKAARAVLRRLGLERLVEAVYAVVNGGIGRFRFVLENGKLRKYF
jgi:hypothetical protein